MNEIEVKILEVNVPRVTSLLEQTGASKVFEGDIHALYFDDANGVMRDERKILRLRKRGDVTELTLKIKPSDQTANPDMKVREETETTVGDFDQMKEILVKLGFKPVLEEKKHRVSYAHPEAHFEFDTFEGIPTYLEIEAKEPEILKNWVERIGYKMEDTKPFNSKQVVEHYGRADLFKTL